MAEEVKKYLGARTGVQIDEAVFRAVNGGELDQKIEGLTAGDVGAEPTISVLPVEKGGTGGESASGARRNLGISYGISIAAGATEEITLKSNGGYLIVSSSNVSRGIVEVACGAQIRRVTDITTIVGWSYDYERVSEGANTGTNLTFQITNTSAYSFNVYVISLTGSIYWGE